ncbi:hypothetical protein [Apilactobacillus xinyiensis]|uniref:hypothetical protein n=1 Tax=Apilactobacillus xinyiensis TaxID=2841032 RepID=UPI00200E3673|nr:hypothetical protein [Apilactobacillus xinyiensis]MCL0318311.1 hypothetical protein [Apilactobacillus xinyiensis]
MKNVRFSYYRGISYGSLSVNFLEDRLNYIYSQSKLNLLDYMELYQINEFIKKFKNKISFKNDSYSISNNYKILNTKKPSLEYIIRFVKGNVIKEPKFIFRTDVYHSFIWKFIISNKLYKSRCEIEKLINIYNNKISIIYPLRENHILEEYSDFINSIICNNLHNAEYIINENSYSIYPKKFIENKFKYKLFKLYLDSDIKSYNYVQKIIFDKKISTDAYEQSSIILKAKDILSQMNNKMFNNSSNYLNQEFFIKGSKNLKVIKKTIQNHNHYGIVFNESMLGSYISDNYSILNNLIYIFDLVDKNFLINAINKCNEQSILDSLFTDNGKNMYNYDHSRYNDIMNYSSFKYYYLFLKSHNILLENIVSWFFKEYLLDEFGIDKFKEIYIINDSSNYMDKCVTLVAQLHRILTTYKLYVSDNNFDIRLIDNMRTPNFYDLPSLTKKYVYLNDNDLNKYSNYLFSSNVGRHLEDRTNFIDIEYKKLYDFEKSMIDEMVEYNLLKIDNGIIKIKNTNLFVILRYQYFKGVIPYYWAMNDDFINYIDNLLTAKKAYFYNNLFTRDEANYFEYVFSDRFNNGISLRNKYAHGSANSLSNQAHKENYMRILYMILLLIIKINEELDHDKNIEIYKKEFKKPFFL